MKVYMRNSCVCCGRQIGDGEYVCSACRRNNSKMVKMVSKAKVK